MKVISCKLPDLNILHGTKFIVVKPRLNVVMLFVLLLGFVTLINADDYEAAQKKLNLAKVTSDLSEHEIEDNKKRRRPTKIYSTDDEDDEKNYWRSRVQKKHKSCNLPSLLPPPPVELITSRPPPLNQSTSCTTSTKDTSSLEFVFDDTPFAQSPSVQLTQELITTRPLPDHQSTPSRRGATSTASLDFVFDRTAYEVLLSHILVVKEQNKQILAILNKKSENVLPTLPELQVDLPMKNHEAIDKFEAELQNEEVMKSFGSYLATLGGRDLTTSTNRVLRYLLTDSLAADYSYFGKKGKRAFVDLKTFNKLIFDNYQRKLKRFRFHPQKNSSCYQVYTSADKVDGYSCKRPHEESKRSCVTPFKGNDSYCEISTPSGERVIVPCTRPTEPDPTRDFGTDLDYSYLTLESSIECYEVYKSGFDRKELCPEVLPPLATGIVTPDGYTILLQSKLCKTYKSKEEINADKEFTSGFNFDPEERSCYKFYKPDQFISSWNCYDNNDIQTNDIHKSCVDIWEENDKCSVVKSQNDETVILGCEGETNKKPNCLSIHKDGNTTEVCMEILEEGCLGITTPSGLRMLIACRTCNRYKDDIVTYNREFSRRRRKFIKTYLNNELKGRNSYYRNYFEILINEEVKKPHVPIWLPDSNCYGLALDNKENVLFKCTDREFSKPGCFKVTTSGGKDETDICAFIYEENCVIIETPKGGQIILACHDEKVGKGQVFAESELQNFRNGMYTFDDTDIDIKQIYNTGKNCKQQVEDYQTQWLHEHQCWGAVTPGLETIILECPYNKNEIKNGCFQVYAQKYGADNEIVPSSYENYETCIKVINDKCVGVVTRKGWHVQLSCYK